MLSWRNAPGCRHVAVCVLGGGPGGAAIAARLATLGHRVCLVEATAFPRPQVDASLPAAILPLLAFVGARERVEQGGFLRAGKTLVWWSQPTPAIHHSEAVPGYHVDRGRFDELLLRNAQEHGVEVLQPARALPPVRLSDHLWRVPVRVGGRLENVFAPVIVDAAGRGNPLGGRRCRAAPPLLALYAHWEMPDRRPMEGCVEAADDEWYWAAPAGGARALATVFLDPQRLRAVGGRNVRSFYEERVGRFRLFARTGPKGIIGGVHVCDASFSFAAEPSGPGFVRVGDASTRLDPLSSQGVLSAIASGIQAAAVANTFLRSPENAAHAVEFYGTCQRERIEKHTRTAAVFYREKALQCEHPFWRARMSEAGVTAAVETPARSTELPPLATRVRLGSGAAIVPTVVLRDDLIRPDRALLPPGASRPIAFVGGVELLPLLFTLQQDRSLQSLLHDWSGLPPRLARDILQWLWARHIIEPVA